MQIESIKIAFREVLVLSSGGRNGLVMTTITYPQHTSTTIACTTDWCNTELITTDLLLGREWGNNIVVCDQRPPNACRQLEGDYSEFGGAVMELLQHPRTAR